MQSVETVQGRTDGYFGGNCSGDVTGEIIVRAMDNGEIELTIGSEDPVRLYLDELDAQDLARALNKAVNE